jgi:hypothetical protein
MANIMRKRRGENKVDFQTAQKVGESGIFRGMDVYYPVMAAVVDLLLIL